MGTDFRFVLGTGLVLSRGTIGGRRANSCRGIRGITA
jgi:hypothetical protein